MPLISQRRVRLELLDLDTGARAAEIILVTTNAPFNPQGRCVYSDGVHYFVSYFNGTNERLAKVSLSEGVFTIEEDVAAPFIVGDAKYDGVKFYCVDATNIYSADDWKFANAVTLAAHGIASVGSLLIQGDRLIVTGNP